MKVFAVIRLLICISIFCIPQSSKASPLTGQNVRQAKEHEFPFTVSLSLNNRSKTLNEEGKHVCGGTLITRKHVLTAAHCFKKFKLPQDFVVKVGDTDLVKSKEYGVKKWTTYDKWANNEIAGGMVNDIAVVELNRCVSSSIKPAILSRIPEKQLYGKKVMTAGWGMIKNDTKSRHLMSGEVSVLKAEVCIANLHPLVKDQIHGTTHIFMCTSANPSIFVESGDSGSPLFLQPNEIIAVNKGTCVNEKGVPICQKQNFHISVNHYRRFIDDMIKFGRICLF